MLRIIYLLDHKYDETINILNEGQEIESYNIDILYNLAYVYELLNNVFKAYRYYIKAYFLNNDKKLVEEILNKMLSSIALNYKLKKLQVIINIANQMDTYING